MKTNLYYIKMEFNAGPVMVRYIRAAGWSDAYRKAWEIARGCGANHIVIRRVPDKRSDEAVAP